MEAPNVEEIEATPVDTTPAPVPASAPVATSLEEVAHQLGLDLPGDNDLLWIARERTETATPAEWESFASDGSVYYRNTETNVSTWEHPLDTQYRRLAQQHKARRTAGLPFKSSKDDLMQQFEGRPQGRAGRSLPSALHIEEEADLSLEHESETMTLNFEEFESFAHPRAEDGLPDTLAQALNHATAKKELRERYKVVQDLARETLKPRPAAPSPLKGLANALSPIVLGKVRPSPLMAAAPVSPPNILSPTSLVMSPPAQPPALPLKNHPTTPSKPHSTSTPRTRSPRRSPKTDLDPLDVTMEAERELFFGKRADTVPMLPLVDDVDDVEVEGVEEEDDVVRAKEQEMEGLRLELQEIQQQHADFVKESGDAQEAEKRRLRDAHQAALEDAQDSEQSARSSQKRELARSTREWEARLQEERERHKTEITEELDGAFVMWRRGLGARFDMHKLLVDCATDETKARIALTKQSHTAYSTLHESILASIEHIGHIAAPPPLTDDEHDDEVLYDSSCDVEAVPEAVPATEALIPFESSSRKDIETVALQDLAALQALACRLAADFSVEVSEEGDVEEVEVGGKVAETAALLSQCESKIFEAASQLKGVREKQQQQRQEQQQQQQRQQRQEEMHTAVHIPPSPVASASAEVDTVREVWQPQPIAEREHAAAVVQEEPTFVHTLPRHEALQVCAVLSSAGEARAVLARSEAAERLSLKRVQIAEMAGWCLVQEAQRRERAHERLAAAVAATPPPVRTPATLTPPLCADVTPYAHKEREVVAASPLPTRRGGDGGGMTTEASCRFKERINEEKLLLKARRRVVEAQLVWEHYTHLIFCKQNHTGRSCCPAQGGRRT